MRLQGKVAVITGSTSGLGRCTALLFAKEGAKVVVSGRDIQRGEETVQNIRAAGGDAIFIRADVSMPEDVQGLVKDAVRHYGKLDVMVNNAGMAILGNVLNTSVEDWDRLMAIDLRGVFLGCKYAIPEMLKNGKGSIINVASVAGMIGVNSQVAYAAAKGGIILLTKATATDFADKNIRVNCVSPGAMKTGMVEALPPSLLEEWAAEIPMGRFSEDPTEVAYGILFLASDECPFMTGSVLAIDGGQANGIISQLFRKITATLEEQRQ